MSKLSLGCYIDKETCMNIEQKSSHKNGNYMHLPISDYIELSLASIKGHKKSVSRSSMQLAYDMLYYAPL